MLSASPNFLSTRSPTTIPPNSTNSPVGDLITNKSIHHCRVLLQNPNGLSYDNECFEYLTCLQNMHDCSCDIILLSETNLDWKNYRVFKQTSNHRRSVFKFSKQIHASSSLRFDTPYQPGGVATLLTQDTVGRYHSSQVDDLGRWTVTNLSLRGSTLLSIVNCYQVCQQRPQSAGAKTAFMQQWTALRQRDILSPNPRKQFISDLDSLLATIHSQGHHILLCGDFNESLGDNLHGLDKIYHKYNLCDAVDLLHDQTNVPTYSRGTKRLDYIFVSPSLRSAVKRSGIAPFDTVYISDHRAVFVDLDLTAVGANTISLAPPSMRLLHSSNTKHRSIYIDHLHRLLTHHRVFHRVRSLNVLSDSRLLIEQLDRDITRSMLAAEKRLARPSSSPFSSQLAQACLSVTILKHHLKALRQNRGPSSSISTLQEKMKTPIILPDNVDETKTMLRSARKDVRRCRRNATNLRFMFLDGLEQDPALSKIIKRIRQAEEVRLMYLKIRHILRPSTSSVINNIQIPSDGLPPKQATQWQTITDPDTITSALYNRNVSHFAAAFGTPFTTPPLSQDYNWCASSPSATTTLNGTFTPYADDLVNRILRHLNRKVPPTLAPLTLSQLIRRLRRWRETTCTSPSRRHLGHYRVLLPPAKFDLDEYMSSKAGQILQLHLQIINYCAMTGYSLHRWKKIVTTVIPKEHNNHKIHRFRVIHLYEADLTSLFSTWSRRMVRASEQHNAINNGSFGARPGRSSTDPVFITLLQTELAHLTRSSLLCCPNDAAQCYDRIVPNHALLSCLSHGMPSSAASCIGSTLLQARYHLKTSLSETDFYWQHSPSTPIYGTGQGSGISPGICCMTYSDLFDAHSEINYPSLYMSPTGNDQISINNIGFVDDTTTTTNDLCLPASPPLPVLLSRLQHSVQQWNDLLFVTGGALELSKTELYALTWSFSPLGFPIINDNTSQSINLTSSTSSINIPVSSTFKSFKILGFQLSLAQTMQHQFEKALLKSHQRAQAISGSSTDHRESWLAYFSVWFPSLSYILPLTTFSPKQCFQLQSTPTSIFLQKCGYASTTKRLLVFASRSSGGLGFRQIFVEQGISHLLKFFQSIRTPGYPRSLLLLTLRWWHIQSGMDYNLLEFPNRPCIHLDGQWLVSLREFLSTCSGSIRFHDTYHPTPLRLHDVSLMRQFAATLSYGAKRMRILNHCRIYLKVTFISELTTALGDSLLPEFWCGEISLRQSHPIHYYPRQAKPSSAAWNLWRAAIRRTFCFPRTTRLRVPLGEWLTASHHRYFAVTKSPDRLWKLQTSPIFHPALPLRSNIFSRTSRKGSPPSLTLPVDILSTRNHVAVSAPHNVRPSPLPSVATTLHQWLSCLPPWQERLLRHVHHSSDPSDVCRYLCSNSLTIATTLAASDGGASSATGSFGWTIQRHHTDLVSCFGPTDGFTPGSYRSECTGVLSLLLYLSSLQRFESLPYFFLEIHIDNIALVHRLHNLQHRIYFAPSEGTHSERDLLLEVEQSLQTIQGHLSFLHVHGHQDEVHPSVSLSPAAKANIRADSLATHGLQSCASLSHPLPTPASVCQLSIHDTAITRHLPQQVRFLYFDHQVRAYITQRFRWYSPNIIAWSVFQTLCRRNSRLLRFYFKLVHFLLPTGTVVHRYHPSHSPLCPACNLPEDNEHFLLCSHVSRRPYHVSLLSDLRRAVNAVPSDPVLRDILVTGVNCYFTSQPFPFQSFPASYSSLCISQDVIGWHAFIRGFVSPHWTTLQDAYYRQHHPKLIGTLGVLRSVDTIWASLHSLWLFRNQQRHSSDGALQESELERKTNHTLRDLYSLRLSVLPPDRRVFRSTLDDHLRESLSNRVAWVSAHEQMLRSSHEAARRDNVQHTLPLSHYFPAGFSPP